MREKRAHQFRVAYGSDRDGHANEYPYFIGVFDTVAALGVARPIRLALGVVGTIVTGLAAAGFASLLSGWLLSFLLWFAMGFGIPLLAVIAAYVRTHMQYHPVDKRIYFANWSVKFYDNKLNRLVAFARHALSIDETRADFDRVEWVYDGDERQRAQNQPEMLRQIWFAGDHSISAAVTPRTNRVFPITHSNGCWISSRNCLIQSY